jgi:DNA polymerase alpha subunit A
MEYYETSDQLIHLVKQGDFDSFLTVKLMFKLQLLPLSLQLTNLAGNLW